MKVTVCKEHGPVQRTTRTCGRLFCFEKIRCAVGFLGLVLAIA